MDAVLHEEIKNHCDYLEACGDEIFNSDRSPRLKLIRLRHIAALQEALYNHTKSLCRPS